MEANETLKETALYLSKGAQGRKNASLSPSILKTGGQLVEKEEEDELKVRIPLAGVTSLHVTCSVT